MAKYITRRLINLFPVLFGVLLLTFLIMQLAPGDPALIYWRQRGGNQAPTAENLERIREEYGLNDPMIVQFSRWLVRTVQLDFGESVVYARPVVQLVYERLPFTVLLSLSAIGFAVAVSIPLGLLSALWQDTLFDNFIRVLAVGGAAFPSFWLALLLIFFVSYKLNLLPIMGTGSIKHLILPTLSLGLGIAAPLTRLVRASMIEVLGQTFITTAYSKGLRKSTVIRRHALRNVLIPLLTVAGMQLAFLLGGTVIVESIFSWPGMGNLVLQGIMNRDYVIIRAFVVIMGVISLLANLIVDILYVIVDPRIRFGD